MNRFLAALMAAGLTLFGVGATAAPVTTPHATTELVAQTRGAAPGSTLHVAVVLTAAKGWHTYWRNPGDAGEATAISWTLPDGWRAGDIVWPAPRRLPVGPIMNYGYEGRVVLAVPLQIPAGAKPGDTGKVSAVVDYLVCAEVCVPGSASVSLAVPISAGTPAAEPEDGPVIAKALADAPKPGGFDATFQVTAGRLTLSVAGKGLAGRSDADVYFYPYSDSVIDQAKPQAVERGAKGLSLALAPGAAFTGAAASPRRSPASWRWTAMRLRSRPRLDRRRRV